MKVVLDTNVLVSGLLNPYGPPGKILGLLAEGSIQACYDARILAEYREVLGRDKFDFDSAEVTNLLAQVEHDGVLSGSVPLARRLPDLTDEPFLEVALATGAPFLITGNTRHYPSSSTATTKVVTPIEFLDAIR